MAKNIKLSSCLSGDVVQPLKNHSKRAGVALSAVVAVSDKVSENLIWLLFEHDFSGIDFLVILVVYVFSSQDCYKHVCV